MGIKRIIFLGLLMFTSLQMTMAQSMTDNQIISYAKQRYSSGTDAKTIAKELLTKGATKEQLQKLAAQYKSGKISMGNQTGMNGQTTMNGQIVMGSQMNMQPMGNDSFSRARVNNGETADLFADEMLEALQPEKKIIFGHDIFRSKELSFEPNMSMAISPTYVLGAGDELIIDVYGASQTSQKLTVAPDGSVTIPKIGPVNVAGLSVERAQARVRGAMGSHYTNSTIKVSVGQTRTITISVMGEVNTPGTYTLSAFATVFHALYMAGGVNDLGTMRNIQVARNGRIISTVDVYEYIVTGRLAGNVKLRDNDVIIVGPYNNLVQIDGHIKRPMWYEMKKNESLKALLRFCGGFNGDAYTKTITVNRKAGDKYSVYTVDEFDFSSFKLADEDSINIRGNEKRYENMVTVSGGVKRPGSYGLKASGTIKGLIALAGGLDEQALVDHAVMVRMNPDRTRRMLSIDLGDLMSGITPDIALENEDSLVIASQAKNIDDRSIDVDGEVWTGGRFPYTDNASIQDYIIMAGGLKESASFLNIEVSRRNIVDMGSSTKEQQNQTFTFSINPDFTLKTDTVFNLHPYDKVYIHRSPAYEEQKKVMVEGEVMFAGTYSIQNNTRLSEIIKKAGGLKQFASAHNARLTRKFNETELARAKQIIMMAKNSSDTLKIDTADVEKTYAVGIDLAKAIEKPGSNYDVILRDGDKLVIPTVTNTVRISGEVLHPNNITFMEGKSGNYYISEAGGFTKRSYKSHAYVVYANGHVSKLSQGKIEPGCEIIVPTKEKRNNLNAVTQWVAIGSTVATLSAVLVTALKK